MKVPTIFTTDRNLDQKIKDLREGKIKPKEFTYEEDLIVKDPSKILDVLYAGLEQIIDQEEFERKAGQVKNNAINKIIQDTYDNKIKWEKDPDEEAYKTKATVINASGKKIIIPVLFLIGRFDSMVGEQAMGFLHLGDKNSAYTCLNTNDKHIKKFAETYFKIKLV